MPSLSTSLCVLLGPGALPRLRNLTILMRVSESISATRSANHIVSRFFQVKDNFVDRPLPDWQKNLLAGNLDSGS